MLAEVIVDIVHENVVHTFTYRVPEGMALQPGQRVSVPFGSLKKEGVVLSLKETCDLPPEKLRDVLCPLEDYPAILPPLISLARYMADRAPCPLAETLRLMLPAEMRGGRVQVKEQPVVRLTGALKPEQLEAQGRSQKRRLLLDLLSDGAEHPVGEMRLLVRDPLPALRQLEEQGLVAFSQREVLRSPGGPVSPLPDPQLTPSQEEALSLLRPAVDKGEGSFLLFGVTGSGKTEVFIRLVRRVLEMGKTALILVPEIALTPQMVSWFRARFGEVAAVLHSRLSAGERFDEWRRLRRGDARVAIGARSAVFAPVENLGLIVVDEEHESTYQSDHHPRYDTREVAEWRCREEGAVLLLSSATPSILSFARTRRGDLRLIEMPSRVMNRPLPEVSVVDMRQELREGNRSIFSIQLQKALQDCVARGEQAMLLMNHRGYSSFVSCRGCGQAIKCPNCDVAMTYHLSGGDGQLHCHYCGYTAPVPTVCPSCESRYIRYFGSGTQKVEEELRKLFPGTGIVRMDVDTTSGKDGHAKLLDEFRSGRARLLVGTQMIAKGHDFPSVTLVGIVAADLTLNLPDYRCRERTFQLLTQAAGRAGRGEKPGQVIIQTYKPEDLTIQAAASQDYRAFFEMEFDRRRAGLYPPFTAVARLLTEANSPEAAAARSGALYNRCLELLETHPAWKRRVPLMAPGKPSVSLLRGRYRHQVLFKILVHPEAEAFAAALADLAREEDSGTTTVFEYNPTSLM
ncbi:MAG: primosomal protein N' [Clostridia bacterium]|nr:primosomal protein N' [Clostridia bacterium]